jgi:hypothetical protein
VPPPVVVEINSLVERRPHRVTLAQLSRTRVNSDLQFRETVTGSCISVQS